MLRDHKFTMTVLFLLGTMIVSSAMEMPDPVGLPNIDLKTSQELEFPKTSQKSLIDFTNPHINLNYGDLIVAAYIDPQARGALIEKLCWGLIPHNTIKTINFKKLLQYIEHTPIDKLDYRTLAVMVMHLSLEDFPENFIFHIRTCADQQDPAALNFLGCLYSWGKGVDKNYKIAFDYYKLAADQGNIHAQLNLANRCLEGGVCSKDPSQALKYLQLAADKGLPKAQHLLADMYENGTGVTKDLNLSLKYYHLAADQGFESAQLSLGLAYYVGKEVPLDLNQAIHYFQLAAHQGCAFSQYQLGEMYQMGHGAAIDMDQAIFYYQMAADQGCMDSQYQLGHIYQFGSNGVTANPGLAIKYHRQAADLGHAKSQHHLGIMYQNGEGVAKDPAQAFKYYQLSADQGDGEAQYKLGEMYKSGEATPKDLDQAFKYIKLSADQKDACSKTLFSLASMYEEGEGCALDIENAKLYYRLAAQSRGHYSDDALAKLDKFDKREAIKIRMQSADDWNGGPGTDFIRNLVVDTPDVCPVLNLEERGEIQRHIDLILRTLNDMDAQYIGISAWAEGEFVDLSSMLESYTALFYLVQNVHLEQHSFDISLSLEPLIKTVNYLKEAGTCVTCLKFNDPYLKYLSRVSFDKDEKTIEYLNFTDFSLESMSTKLLIKQLTKLTDLHQKSHNFLSKMKNMSLEQRSELLAIIKDSNFKFWEFMMCYLKNCPPQDQIEQQQHFFTELESFFKERCKVVREDLDTICSLVSVLERLLDETTSYRNDLFLRYVRIRG